MTYQIRDNSHLPRYIDNEPARWIAEFDTLDVARRYVIDRKLRFWSIFYGEDHVESAYPYLIPGIDDREDAA